MFEPPKFHPLVCLLYWFSKLLGKGPRVTPHTYGAGPDKRRDWEYKQGDVFWREVDIEPWCMEKKRVLDIGCGWGGKALHYFLHYMPKQMCGIDYQAVEFSEPGFRLVKGYAEHLPWRKDAFDIAMLEDVLEHVKDPLPVLLEAYRVLKPNGILIVKFPSIRSIVAHHFDRAINLPAIHYLFSFKTLASGLNWMQAKFNLGFAPFDEVIDGRTSNLNGLTLDGFRNVLSQTGFHQLRLEALPYFHFRGEVMSKTIIYVGVK